MTKLLYKNTGRSLSELMENYLETITKDYGDQEMSPKLKKIVGAIKLPKNFNEEKELRSYLEKSIHKKDLRKHQYNCRPYR